MKILVKINNEFYLVDESPPEQYIYHKRKKEILKVNGVGEISGEVFHEKGFSFKNECLNVLKTTNEKINISIIDRNHILKLIEDIKRDTWEAYLNNGGEIVELK